MKHNYINSIITNTETWEDEVRNITNLHVTNNGTCYITWVDKDGNENVKLCQADMTQMHIYI